MLKRCYSCNVSTVVIKYTKSKIPQQCCILILSQPVNMEYNHTMSKGQTKWFFKKCIILLALLYCHLCLTTEATKKQATTGNSYSVRIRAVQNVSDTRKKCSTEPTLISSRCLLMSVKGSGMSKQSRATWRHLTHQSSFSVSPLPVSPPVNSLHHSGFQSQWLWKEAWWRRKDTVFPLLYLNVLIRQVKSSEIYKLKERD